MDLAYRTGSVYILYIYIYIYIYRFNLGSSGGSMV